MVGLCCRRRAERDGLLEQAFPAKYDQATEIRPHSRLIQAEDGDFHLRRTLAHLSGDADAAVGARGRRAVIVSVS